MVRPVSVFTFFRAVSHYLTSSAITKLFLRRGFNSVAPLHQRLVVLVPQTLMAMFEFVSLRIVEQVIIRLEILRLFLQRFGVLGAFFVGHGAGSRVDFS